MNSPIKRKVRQMISAILLLGLTACQANSASQQQTLTVFAAASLVDVFEEMSSRFRSSNPDVQVILNFASSQQLAQQIIQGATADVFASADLEKMQAVIANDMVDPAQSYLFANNRLVVIYPADNPAGLGQLQDLARPGLKLILGAQAIPVGAYSLKFLELASQDPAFGSTFQLNVLNNVVSYEETVRAVLSKVALGEADAGIVYTSDVGNSTVGTLHIPDSLNVLASYYIAPLIHSHQPDLAQAFIAFVLSPDGQQILQSYGLIPINP